MSYWPQTQIEYADSTSIDGFGRARVSETYTIFDSKQLFNNLPLLYDEVNGGGAEASSHSVTNAATTMTVDNAGEYTIRQTKMRFNYQPGKALDLDEPVLTVNGWRRMGDISVGDKVFDGKGDVTEVVGTALWKNRQCYEIEFDDGTIIIADENHDWNTIIRQNSKKGKIRVVSTKTMFEEYGESPPSFARWRIPQSPNLNIEHKKVPIDSYLLGCILGDGYINKNGSVSLITNDPEILSYVNCEYRKQKSTKYGYGILNIAKKTKELNLNGKTFINKGVPSIYLFNDESVRLNVLRGLMDTDGTCDKRDGTCEFNSGSKQLAEDLAFLVRSLGGQAKIKRRRAGYTNTDGDFVQCNDSYRVRVISPVNPFRLKSKASLWRPRTRISYDRYIHRITPIKNRTTKCIEVKSNEHTFLTRNNVVTHNSQYILNTFVLGAQASGVTKRVGYFNSSTTAPYTNDFDGIYLEDTGSDYNIVQAKTGTKTEIAKASWNIDSFDGSGPSGITIDFTKSQIMFFDFEWLGVGRVRVGFIIDGIPFVAHQFLNANSLDSVYMSSPNHSVRYEIRTTGNTGSLIQGCASVMSEGGQDFNGVLRSIDRGITGYSTGTNTNIHPIASLRLKSTHLSCTVDVIRLSLMVTSTADARWALYFNPTVAGTDQAVWTDVTDGCIQFDVSRDNTNTLSGGVLIESGYLESGGSDSVLADISSPLRLGSKIDGTRDELILAVQNISAQDETWFGGIQVRELL